MDLLKETKLVLKSLVVSSPNKLTVQDLVRDYKKSEGRNIPYNELGYRNLEMFLNSMPDTILVRGSGLSATVSAVITENLAHIDKMVTQQKNATRSRKVSGSITVNEPPKKFVPPRMVKSFVPVEPKIATAPLIPVQNNQNPFTNPQRSNERLPIPKPLLLQHQPNPFNFNQNHLQPHLWQNHHLSFYNQGGYLTPQQQAVLYHQQKNLSYNYNYYDSNEYWRNLAQAEYIRSQAQATNAMASGLWQQQYYKNPPSTEPVKQTNIISAPPVFYNNSQNKVPVPEPTKPSDIYEIPQQSTEEENSGGLPFGIRAQNSDAVEQLLKEMDTQLNLSEISSTPSQYSASDKISKTSSETLSSTYKTYNTSKSKSDELKSPVNVDHGTPESPTEVRKANKVQYDDIASAKCDALPELLQNDILFLIDFPSNTMKWGDRLLPPEIPDNITIGSHFGIFVTEVHNPYKFWFHLHKEDNEFDSLMNDLEHFYKGLMPHELVIPKEYLRPGQVCAATFLNMWHRGEIVELPDQDTIKVFFLDYGTVSKINVNNIKYLVNDFTNLRSQALRGCLASIRPKNVRWSRSATYAFLSVVSDLLLYAKAVKINREEYTLNVLLTDTSAEKDFQINDALICKGYAQLKPESDDDSLSLHYQERYPSFSMLERGEYPNFAEIGRLLAKGIDYEAQMEENILPDLDEDNNIEELAKILTGVKVSPQKSLKDKLLDCYNNENSGKKSDTKTKLSNHNQNNSSSITTPKVISSSSSSFAPNTNYSKPSNSVGQDSLLYSTKPPHAKAKQTEATINSANYTFPQNGSVYLSRIGPPPGFG